MSRRPASTAQTALDFDGWPRIERQDLDAHSDWLAELADASGLEAVRFLVSRWGEMTFTVPKKEQARMSEWLEDVAANHSRGLVRTIIRLRGGESVYIPAPGTLHEAAVKRDVRRLYNGRNASDLAQRFRMSRRWVRDVALAKS